MNMNGFPFSNCPQSRAGLEKERECEIIRKEAVIEHFAIEEEGLFRDFGGIRETSDDGVVDVLIWGLDGVEEGASVVEVSEGREGAEGEDFAEDELGLERPGFDYGGVDLLELLHGFAGF